MTAVPAEALPRILALSRKADSLGVNLLFCQMSPPVEKAVKASQPGEAPHLVASLAEASHFCREKQEHR